MHLDKNELQSLKIKINKIKVSVPGVYILVNWNLMDINHLILDAHCAGTKDF